MREVWIRACPPGCGAGPAPCPVPWTATAVRRRPRPARRRPPPRRRRAWRHAAGALIDREVPSPVGVVPSRGSPAPDIEVRQPRGARVIWCSMGGHSRRSLGSSRLVPGQLNVAAQAHRLRDPLQGDTVGGSSARCSRRPGPLSRTSARRRPAGPIARRRPAPLPGDVLGVLDPLQVADDHPAGVGEEVGRRRSRRARSRMRLGLRGRGPVGGLDDQAARTAPALPACSTPPTAAGSRISHSRASSSSLVIRSTSRPRGRPRRRARPAHQLADVEAGGFQTPPEASLTATIRQPRRARAAAWLPTLPKPWMATRAPAGASRSRPRPRARRSPRPRRSPHPAWCLPSSTGLPVTIAGVWPGGARTRPSARPSRPDPVPMSGAMMSRIGPSTFSSRSITGRGGALELGRREALRVEVEAALGAAEGQAGERRLPGHPGRPRARTPSRSTRGGSAGRPCTARGRRCAAPGRP